MTIIVWDGKVLAADKRGFDKIEFPFKDIYSIDQAADLHDYLGPERGLVKQILNETGPVRKIAVPKKAYFKNSKVRAIGVSGDLSIIEVLNKKHDSDLSFFDSLLYTSKNSFIVLTENFVAKIDNKEPLNSRTIIYPHDSLVTCGGSEFNGLNGAKVALTAEQIINFAIMSDYACGLGIDIVAGKGPKDIFTLKTKPMTKDDLKHFYDTVLSVIPKPKKG